VARFCFKVSKIAPDWATKGFHVYVDGVELSIRPGENASIVVKPVFASAPLGAFHAAAAKLENALNDLAARQQLYADAIRARDYLRTLGTSLASGKSGELNFLMHALKKRGV
jgi:hypothetical protein